MDIPVTSNEQTAFKPFAPGEQGAELAMYASLPIYSEPPQIHDGAPVPGGRSALKTAGYPRPRRRCQPREDSAGRFAPRAQT